MHPGLMMLVLDRERERRELICATLRPGRLPAGACPRRVMIRAGRGYSELYRTPAADSGHITERGGE